MNECVLLIKCWSVISCTFCYTYLIFYREDLRLHLTDLQKKIMQQHQAVESSSGSSSEEEEEGDSSSSDDSSSSSDGSSASGE